MKKVLLAIAVVSLMAILVSSAYAASPIVQQVTGGGWFVGCLGTKCTFGFNAEENPAGEFKGDVEFVDHGDGYPHVHGYEITALTVNENTATIVGNCWLNGDKDTIREFTVVVTDVGEPGTGTYDTFSLSIPSIGYYTIGELGFPIPGFPIPPEGDEHGGGNIVIHVYV